MHSKQISVLAAFLAAKVDYAVVGGVAVIAHGYVRTTNDLDRWDGIGSSPMLKLWS